MATSARDGTPWGVMCGLRVAALSASNDGRLVGELSGPMQVGFHSKA
jgi:hypothetical protein